MSNKNSYLVIIPARLGSERLPNKPLKILGDLPLIAHTYNGVKNMFQHVYIATDSAEICDLCESLNMPYIKTSRQHRNGTTRTLEAYQLLKDQYDYIINVQGDEVFISEKILNPLVNLLETKHPEAATLQAPIKDKDCASNVFVVSNTRNEAIYFSRSPIPSSRGNSSVRFQHIGVYAYTPQALHSYCNLSPTPLEMTESLEQLRWIENGNTWAIATAPMKPLSIDTLEDLEQAKAII
ncbi:MAG: 3-deoxy-manno-octulosonate cytidylyltransferase [Flavobacteriales bacterium]|nr:3-deoxy-manno-octulosonate cytidylyltransferase [Flavobacteriales bacterium]